MALTLLARGVVVDFARRRKNGLMNFLHEQKVLPSSDTAQALLVQRYDTGFAAWSKCEQT